MKNLSNSVENGVKAVSRIAYIGGGWLLIILSVLVCAEIVLRKVFSQSLQGVDEYGGYALAVTSAIGFAFAFYEGSHIRIDVLVTRLPRSLRILSSVVAHLSLLVVAWLFAKYAVLLTIESWEISAFANTPLRTPLFIPQAIWAGGMCLFFVALAVRLLKILEGVARKQWQDLVALLDTRDADSAEIERVLHDIERHGK
ncbi:MAG: TRAP transporter small permease [Rhodospirillales bacterium]|nr:TRAP transporter small permease [Rhodospirillales bacterium]